MTHSERDVKHGEKKYCRECGEEFIPNRHWQKFCSAECRLRHWKAGNVSKAEITYLREQILSMEKKIRRLESGNQFEGKGK